MKLFQDGDFKSHAGLPLKWKLECDAITDEEWRCIAKMVMDYQVQPFYKAVGIPRGGLKFAEAMNEYASGNPEDQTMICDDVFTTGTSFKDFVKETVIDTDFELLFPDDYINNITERLNLYNKLSELKTEEELQKYEADLIDRFGELPLQARDLLNSVRIKWIAETIGLERILMKRGKLVGYFITNQESSFYQSTAFSKVIQYAQNNPSLVKMKEKQTRNGLRLIITFENITTINKARVLLPITSSDNAPIDFPLCLELAHKAPKS